MAAADEIGDSRVEALGLDGISSRGFLARLSPSLIERLVQSAHSAWYPAGTVLAPARQGWGPALVVSGGLRYFLSVPDGRQLTVAYVQPGDLLGSPVRDQKNFSARYEVLEPTTLLHLDEPHVMALLESGPELARAMLDYTIDRLRGAYGLLAGRAFMSVRVRVARDLWERMQMCGCPRIQVTHQSLADATGSVREVVARAIRELRAEKLVASDAAGITILDPTGLARAASM